ncbi:MAG: dipeptidase [Anaerolineae bacterium]
MTPEQVLALHRDSIVIDGHCDTILAASSQQRDFTKRSESGDVDVPRLLEGGVTAQFMALCITDEHRGAVTALAGMDSLFSALARCLELTLATTAADIRQAKANGKVAAILALESSDALEGELGALRMFYRLGLRCLSLTHNLRNRAGDGIFEIETGGGLSAFGRDLVVEANRLGILLDLSHLSPAGVEDVLELTQVPVVATHANAYALRPYKRNLTDEQIKGVAKKGGVVCVTYVNHFLTEDEPTLAHVLDHIGHIASTVGIDHVGLGSDFDGFDGPRPRGLEDASMLPNLTAGLAARGYSEEDMSKVLGGNLLRVIERVCG